MHSLLSYNILFGSRLNNIVGWINKQEKVFDLICFQEFPETDIQRINDILPNADYNHIYSPGIHIRGGSYGELTLYNTAKVKMNNFSIVNVGNGKLERKIFRVHGSRTALIGQFSINKKNLIVANAHLTLFSNNGTRLNQVDMILKAMSKYDSPSIILGDFNYSSIFNRKRLYEKMQKNKFSNALPKHKTHKLLIMKHQLDYIFYKQISINKVYVNQSINFSDHFPIQIELNI